MGSPALLRNENCYIAGRRIDPPAVYHVLRNGHRLAHAKIVCGGCQRCGNALVQRWWSTDPLTCIACGRVGVFNVRQLELAL